MNKTLIKQLHDQRNPAHEEPEEEIDVKAISGPVGNNTLRSAFKIVFQFEGDTYIL
jgi:hypothetical protein